MDSPPLLKNRYRLGSVIGRGGMGVVWLATDELLDRKVAVKEVEFPPGLPAEERDRLRRRTLREARTNARLSHPNVVALYDIVEEEDRPWIVMEYVPSRSLAEALREDGPLAPERAAEVGLQLLAGLAAAHAAGVQHRDVKPSNVLLADDGRVVLGDFGIATAEGGSAQTSSGILIGSPAYMSPERARRGRTGPASDLWSLGATLYTAVEGRPPFDRDSAVAILAALVTEEPDPPRRAGPLAALLQRLLSRDPGDRPDAAEVERELTRVAAGAAGAPPSGEVDEDSLREADRVVPVPVPAAEPAEDDAHDVDEVGTEGAYGPGTDPGQVEERTREAVPRNGRRHTVTALVAAAVVVAGVGGVAGWALLHDGHPAARTSAGKTPSAGRHTTSRPATSRPATPVPATPRPTTGAPGAALPAGYHRYEDRTDFSIGVPNGWKVSHRGHYVYVEDPKSSRYLLIDQTGSPKPDPLKDWREQERNRRDSAYPGYHRIRLEEVDYPQADKAADWEFTYRGSSGRVHILNRNVLANKAHAYALYWSVPDDTWDSSRRYFDVFAASFRPATN